MRGQTLKTLRGDRQLWPPVHLCSSVPLRLPSCQSSVLSARPTVPKGTRRTLTSATANRANEVDIGAALRGGGDLGQAFRHSSPAASSMDAVASPPQRSPDRSLEWRPAFRDGDGEISNVLGLARPSLGGYTPRLEQPHRPFASPVASHRSIQTSLRFDGPDLTQSLAESKSAIIQNCSSARASLQQLSDDVKNFDAAVQKRIQQLRLETTQAKEHEESLKG